jgi:two-component system, LytTR family, sensor histidine kinase AlgZ
VKTSPQKQFYSAMTSAVATPPNTLAFDVCHAGVALRAVLLVHSVMAVELLFSASTPQSWFNSLVMGSCEALPAVLLWLVLICRLKLLFSNLGIAGQWAAALLLGGIAGGFGHGLKILTWGNLFLTPPLETPASWLAPVVAGMACSATLFYGLLLRSRSRSPADAQARLVELQSRIRPHFLFNTLNTAIALVRFDPPRAEGLLEDLAELFRAALSDSGGAVSLNDEVALARRYLAIEQARFGARLKLEWNIAAAAGHAQVPALMLQPLVENAVRHGVEPDTQTATVRIRTRVNRSQVEISISNTIPMQASRPGHGMALANVRERLLLMHDVAAQFEVRSDQHWFSVRMVVPL